MCSVIVQATTRKGDQTSIANSLHIHTQLLTILPSVALNGNILAYGQSLDTLLVAMVIKCYAMV